MQNFYLFLNDVTPSSGSALPISLDLDLLFNPYVLSATGTFSVLANGTVIASGIAYTQSTEQHVTVSLPTGSPGGPLSITVEYSGDSNFNPYTSNALTFTNNADSGGGGGGGGGGSPTLTLSLSAPTPGSAPANAAGYSLYITAAYSGSAPTGNVTLTQNGTVVYGPAPITTLSQQLAAGLSSPATLGPYTLQAHFSGDSTYAACDSNTETFTVTAAVSSMRQAVARVQYSLVAGAALTRTQIENGEMPSEICKVTAIALQDGGAGKYDAYTVAALTGLVSGSATRQTLGIALDSSGGIAALTGIDTTTEWDAPPKLTITRWSGQGDGAIFLGY